MKILKLFIFSFILSFSVSCYAKSDYKDLKIFLENKIEVTKLEIKTLDLKLKYSPEDKTLIENINIKKNDLKNLNEELKIVNKTIKTEEKRNESFEKYQKLEQELETLINVTEKISKNENFEK